MSEKLVELFNADNSEIEMPFSSINLQSGLSEAEVKDRVKSNTELISDGIERALLGDTVNTLMIPEDNSTQIPNYVIDMTTVEQITDHQLEALDSFIHPDGDVAIYANTNGGIVKLGYGLSSILDRILTISIASIIGYECKVYKDYEEGKPLKLVSEKDIKTMRLSI